jgi:hypothetical protein
LSDPKRRLPRPTAGLLGAALVGLLWVLLGVVGRPIEQTCDPQLTTPICLETIDAALRKGLPAIHPLLLTARAEPGPAAGADQLGHRATVHFGLLGVPGPVSVRLFFDAGAHWGGIADRGAAELSVWSMAEGVVIAGVAAGAWTLFRRRRHSVAD